MRLPVDKRRRAVVARCAAAIAAMVVAGSATAAAPARATTYVTQCNALNWPDGIYCPISPPYPQRHTYTTGRAASAGLHTGTIHVEWYVAYTMSNASFYKYNFGGHIGDTLYSPISNNTEYLRAYTYTTVGGGANLYSEGGY
jgi:hypothetical protein